MTSAVIATRRSIGSRAGLTPTDQTRLGKLTVMSLIDEIDLAVMRRLLVAEPVLVPRRAHLFLVAEPLQVLARYVRPWRSRPGGWMWGFGRHEAIVSVLGG